MTRLVPFRPAALAGALLSVLLAAGCASVPDAPVAGPVNVETGPDFLALPGRDAPAAAWWAGFDDPELAPR